MDQNKNNQGVLLNRSKKIEQANDRFLDVFEEVEKETTNSTLATQFPDWDLKPPANFIKRRSSKLL